MTLTLTLTPTLTLSLTPTLTLSLTLTLTLLLTLTLTLTLTQGDVHIIDKSGEKYVPPKPKVNLALSLGLG